jgi:Mn2+/Fe2+ NRAMP family transporter
MPVELTFRCPSCQPCVPVCAHAGLVLPSLTRSAIPTACGLLGAIIMPHNLFLHSALVHSRWGSLGAWRVHRSAACAGAAQLSISARWHAACMSGLCLQCMLS